MSPTRGPLAAREQSDAQLELGDLRVSSNRPPNLPDSSGAAKQCHGPREVACVNNSSHGFSFSICAAKNKHSSSFIKCPGSEEVDLQGEKVK